MNLYLLEQDINFAYDTYDACIVAANSEDEARKINPDPYDNRETWVSYNDIDKIKVRLIGVAADGIESGYVLLASFNAG